MGNLIIMTRSTKVARREPPVGGSAEIFFFTGVRYYRMPDEAPMAQQSAPKQSAPKRRRRPSATKRQGAPRLELQA